MNRPYTRYNGVRCCIVVVGHIGQVVYSVFNSHGRRLDGTFGEGPEVVWGQASFASCLEMKSFASCMGLEYRALRYMFLTNSSILLQDVRGDLGRMAE